MEPRAFLVLTVALAAMGAQATTEPHEIAMTHMTGSVEKDIPVVKHKKEAGNGYLKGSPLYKKQTKLAEPEPEKDDRSKPSLLVIFGVILLGLLVLGCAAFLNKRELVAKMSSEPAMPTSQTKLQSQRLGTPEYVEYVVPPRTQQANVEYMRPSSNYAMPVSGSLPPGSLPPASGSLPVVYSQGSMGTVGTPPTGVVQGGFPAQYATMPPSGRYGTESPAMYGSEADVRVMSQHSAHSMR